MTNLANLAMPRNYQIPPIPSIISYVSSEFPSPEFSEFCSLWVL